MIWFFLAVVLVLMVNNAGFRRVVFWLGGIVAGVFALLVLISVIDNASHRRRVAFTPDPPAQGWQPPETRPGWRPPCTDRDAQGNPPPWCTDPSYKPLQEKRK